ncbi:MAG: hypothetical protein COU40_00630 [Candidatus Moranbacteria bacterium CG10_big_fil_rev_8_21_14_0_10_35_21]|nr:MAG: hypothetical protein COU40_00630 [Candidatus Moranbacteria bacterium CG10_big_fil_rev_8_21_14_0_10_35_21]PJA88495.1 MAG: hypothetical protein CO139_02820 [Candidatus Moranbacteria bacterium CG_4_9_14_3_um_filter_36_9]
MVIEKIDKDWKIFNIWLITSTLIIRFLLPIVITTFIIQSVTSPIFNTFIIILRIIFFITITIIFGIYSYKFSNQKSYLFFGLFFGLPILLGPFINDRFLWILGIAIGYGTLKQLKDKSKKELSASSIDPQQQTNTVNS